ncbi:MAG TPA: DUF488 domain-containing protein [Candidatus Cloacimonadota bacterium]|nr:DUF488 domain-containing protein [Candidatus Cloacimonadota bacterium]
MYYRRKIILAILDEFGGQLPKTSFQKLLFLFTRMQEVKSFDFVPYSFGCFSFSANQDLLTLKKYGIVKEQHSEPNQYWVKSDDVDYLSQLTKQDYASVKLVAKEFRQMDQDELIKFTYQKYPYFAINSKIAAKLLDSKSLGRINEQKRVINEPTLFNIGYEGKSFEQFINQLVINDVRLLIDVRKNALSKKYGFSKSQISRTCESMNIKYIHLPELGIDSGKRKDLQGIADYNRLFKEYETSVLQPAENSNKEIIEKLRIHKRVALMCFEKEAVMCHRGRIVNHLNKLLEGTVPVKNL